MNNSNTRKKSWMYVLSPILKGNRDLILEIKKEMLLDVSKRKLTNTKKDRRRMVLTGNQKSPHPKQESNF
jgi:hypothetical protein